MEFIIIILLVVLVCALAAVIAVTAVISMQQRRKEEQRAADVVAAVADMRRIVAGVDPSTPVAEWQASLQEAALLHSQVKHLDPDNKEVDRLAVPLSYAAADLDQAVALFNTLDAKEIAKEMGKGSDATAMRKAGRAI